MRKSMPEISTPLCVMVFSTSPLVESPEVASTGCLVVFSRGNWGVVRTAIGEYAGFCQMGESRSLPSWNPLSRKACPNGFSSGQTVWQAEHGRLYLRAKAGMLFLALTDRS